jgi:uncharacterized membrane protein
MADKKKMEDIDQRLIGVIIGAVGLVLFVIGVTGVLRITFLGVIGVLVGVIVYFVGVNNKKKWEQVKKDLYPDGEPEGEPEGEDAGGKSQ